MTRRLVAGYVGLVLAVLLLLAIPLGLVFARSEREHLEDDLRHDALSLALLASDRLAGGSRGDLDAIVRDYSAESGARAVIVDARGTRVADSDPVGGASPNYGTRPEIAAALRGGEVTGVRRSDTLDVDLLYVAAPVATGGRIHGAVRLTYPMSVVDARVRRAWLSLGLFGFGVLVLASSIGVGLARSLNRPLRDLADASERLGQGDLAARAPLPEKLPEVRQVAQVFNETAAKLGALVNSQQEFVANASHQLRSPLAALRLRLENLEYELPGGTAASSEVAASLREVHRLSRLVDGLLALARSDQAAAASAPVDLAEAAYERARAWSAYAEERSVRAVVSVDSPVVALATPGHVEQVLDNLLANAFEVAPAGSAVTLTVGVAGGYAEVRVADEGPGMTEAERERAFDRFWRSPSARAGGSGGSGLGLAIVARLVRVDGGTVSLGSAPGGGLEAVVRLPLAAVPAAAPA